MKEIDLEVDSKRSEQGDKKQSIHEVAYLDDTALRWPGTS